MKLQYLGDSKDAFKWDLIHWICSTTSFNNLVFVPMRTEDVADSGEGLTPHKWFKSKESLHPFLESLREPPRTFERISKLGRINYEIQFDVTVFEHDRIIGSGPTRQAYWDGFDVGKMENSVVFFDPDNGYETRGQNSKGKVPGQKWLGHDELKKFLEKLPESSVALVYQHQPHRKWSHVFEDLAYNLDYAHTAVAVHASTLAFIAVAGNASAGETIAVALETYAYNKKPLVSFQRLVGQSIVQ